MAYWARSGVWRRISAPIHSPLAWGAWGGWLQRPPLPNCGPKSADWIWSNGWISFQAASPTVPETSIFSFRMDMKPKSFTTKDSKIHEKKLNRDSAVREPLVQHEIDYDSRYRDVHPERPGPTGDGAVFVVAGLQASVQGDDGHWYDYDREHDVRDQNCEVDGPRPSLTEKK